ncbi:nucleolar protein dao-5-like isoform X3 [Trichoplusia ni]|uniref:Nucleolar protein dao-5-like isoform X3 n=1 Tax=Trichoplusia ni TaxID=7111 RepID=A0A7E5VPE1_TRINI|nr:nucleolar protein dao-5-like isoform X3 [Trichoplusia ni]
MIVDTTYLYVHLFRLFPQGCKQQFHVTCAQGLGLLCEEAGNYLDNVKYCGYCQHHYSKLFTNHDVTIIAKKKGGNVKTIPPYKPVSHDSQSSDSSCEKEGEASCSNASGGVTPTHAGKSKGPGRKSSSSTSHVVLGKNTPNSSKPLDLMLNEAAAESGHATRKHKSSEKNKKKPSPSRRGSSAGDGGSGSKSSTPAPSPQHTTDSNSAQMAKASGSSTPAGPSKATPPPVASPSANKTVEPVGVISSVAQAVASVSTITTVPTSAPSAPATPAPAPPTAYQESVITNTEFVETKQTKKRKAVSAANNMNTPVDYTSTTPPTGAGEGTSQSSAAWEAAHAPADVQLDSVDKVIKKVKTEGPEGIPVPTSHFASVSAAPPLPPPPPAHSPASNPSPRHLPSPMPGPSGINHVSNIRSPSNPPQGKGDREGPASLLVSVPLPSTSHGLNLTAHSQVPLPEMPGPSSSHIFHQPQKQAAMDTGMPAHSPHVHPGRSWGGLNVAYEHQQDPNKQGNVGVMAGTSKDMSAVNIVPMPPTTVRTKKRAAMATSVVAMANAASSAIQTVTTHSAPNVRRHPQPTPPPIYSETIKDSPPNSPNAERSLQPKMETRIRRRKQVFNNLRPNNDTVFASLINGKCNKKKIREKNNQLKIIAGESALDNVLSKAGYDVPEKSPEVTVRGTHERKKPTKTKRQKKKKAETLGVKIKIERIDESVEEKTEVCNQQEATSIINIHHEQLLRDKALEDTNQIHNGSKATSMVEKTAERTVEEENVKERYRECERSKREKVKRLLRQLNPSCTAPHMLGNELNPESGAAACLQEQLTAELAAHAAGSAGGDTLIPPPLINKAAPGSSGIVGRSSGAQSLDQLLERQWEQGSQFLMEQAQHFDNDVCTVASLLSCLHQLRTENVRLEEHVGSLLQRRDHLLAVNARLAIPLTTDMVDGDRCYNSSDVPLRSDDWAARAEPWAARERPANAGPPAAAAGPRYRDRHLGPTPPAYNA